LQDRLIATPRRRTDFGQIEADLLDFSTRFQVREIAYDPCQATQLATRLQGQGAKVIDFRQTVANCPSPPRNSLPDALRQARP
jgi:phage terminase large subunit-like protein